ncbi:MAG: DNRLRE domain-containing protein, partial [Deltaproteobacteria bacterium]
MLRRPKADKANGGRHVSAGRLHVLAAAGESAMDRKRGEGRGAGCRTPGVSAGAVMMPHRLLALLGVLGACLATSGPAHAVTVTLPSAQDSWLGQDAPNTNHGADSHMHVQSGVGKVRRGIIQFNLSSIPACASIDSATLQLSLENADNSSRIYEVHRVAASWTELGVTWNRRNSTTLWTSAGGDFVAAPTDSVPTGTVNNVLLQWNVTPDVAAFVSGAATNAGWLVKDSVENGAKKEFTLRNREDTDGGGPQPQLVVTYTLANTPACDDGNACTTDTCDPVAGCQYASVANGTACDDNDACTSGETCQNGTCGSPTSTVTCTALDQCHVAGTCDPTSGVCPNPAAADGTV